MLHAPAVACTVNWSRFVGWSMLALWLGGALLAVWAAVDTVGAAGSGWRLLVLGSVVCATGAFAGFQWLRAPQGTLRWDGQEWWWQAAGGCERAGTPALRLDLQRRLLVRWLDQTDDSVLWFWLDVGSTGGSAVWHALRCALHARLEALPDPRADDRTSTATAGTSS